MNLLNKPPSQEFAWDGDNECFYYINNPKMAFTKVSKSQNPEVYEFLYYVYCVNWNVIKDRLTDYTYFATMKEISDY